MRNLHVVIAVLLAAVPSLVLCTGCRRGAIIKKECNTCICDANGKWACTGMICPRRKRDAACSPEEMEDPLIKCACVDKGYGSEEDKAQCYGHVSSEREQVERVKRSGGEPGFCIPGTTFMEECNICKCNDKGTWAACTQKLCYDPCRPGSVKFVNCNVCVCHPNEWKCTTSECPSEEKLTLCPKYGYSPKRGSRCKREVPAQGLRLKRGLRTETSTQRYVCLGRKGEKKNCNTCRPKECKPQEPAPYTHTEPPKPSVCLPTHPFIKNCNTCRGRVC